MAARPAPSTLAPVDISAHHCGVAPVRAGVYRGTSVSMDMGRWDRRTRPQRHLLGVARERPAGVRPLLFRLARRATAVSLAVARRAWLRGRRRVLCGDSPAGRALLRRSDTRRQVFLRALRADYLRCRRRKCDVVGCSRPPEPPGTASALVDL